MSLNRVILTHEHTDFDALASLLAAHLLFPDALPVLPRQLNRNVSSFLSLYGNQFPFRDPQFLSRGRVEQAIVVDTRSVNSVKGMDQKTRFLVIDHHESSDPLPEGWENWEDALGPHSVGANVTLLLERLMLENRELNRQQATLLALGIYEDTGSLLYQSTTHRDLRCAAWLVENGADLERVRHFTHFPMSDAQQELTQKLVDGAEHIQIAGQSLLIVSASSPDFEDELSGIAHRIRELYDPAGLFVVVDLGDRIQVVGRSTTDAVDVGIVARALGGGGHTRAAAALLRDESLESVRQRILEVARQHVKPPTTVQQIMSRGRPQSLPPDMSVGDAMERMRRYGHEGFPILSGEGNEERLVGILTRREADRALNHRMEEEPVRRIMRTGEVTIGADAPIEELHRKMLESGWGQIPVTDSHGEIIGIVTRTDLIKLWSDERPPESQLPDVSRHLLGSLSPIQHGLLRLAGERAAARGYAVYVVGGFVRDLLLDRIESEGVPDIDIVVEGDAIALAHEIASESGGRVVTHGRFGTAKWILEGLDPESDLFADLDQSVARKTIPGHLDFVTARTEFYTEPTVLPTVEQGSIKLDLHRRDFTINTLAVVLTPDRWGDLLDFYSGLADLQDGLVRVLHSLSFIDDPTRILRAVRYEQRFGFEIESRTRQLLCEALPFIERVSEARIRHELERIFQEERPEISLLRLDELGVLQHIHSALKTTPDLSSQFEMLRNRLHANKGLARQVDEPIERLYWGLLLYPLLPSHPAEDESQSLATALEKRLMLRGESRRLVAALQTLKARRTRLLESDLRASEVVALLDSIPISALFLLSILEGSSLLDARLNRYIETWREVRPSIDGTDLRAMGLKPSPLFGHILKGLRAALLDGEIEPGEAERKYVETLIHQSRRSP